MKHLRDEQLFLHYRETGKQEYFDELYTRWWGLLVGWLCNAYAGRLNQQDIEDACASVFSQLNDYCKSDKPLRNVQAWLYTATHNEAIDLLRHAKRIKRGGTVIWTEFTQAILTAEGVDDPEAAAIRVELAELLAHALNNLDERQAGALRAIYFDGLTIDNAAAKLNASPASIKRWAASGLAVLRNEMEPTSI